MRTVDGSEIRYEADHRNSSWVTLTMDEVDYACRVGLRMRKVSLARGHKDYRNSDEKTAQRIQCVGACAELAVRKFMGYPMELVTENFGDADLPDNIEVKALGAESYGLRIYPRTHDSRICVGVVIPPGKEREPYRLAGWIRAGDGKQDQWSIAPCGRPPMFAVPQSELGPMNELKEHVGGR